MTTNDTALLRISDAASLFRLTPRALRYYEQKGLVVSHRGGLGERYYDGVARERLAVIALLRRAGVALWDIDEVLRAEDPHACATAKLAHRRAELAANLERLSAVLDQVEALDVASSEPEQRNRSPTSGG